MGHAIVTVSSKLPLPEGIRALGKGAGLVWAAWPWNDTGDVPRASCLAYLDETAFRAGTAGLQGRQIAEVMAKRAGAQDQVLPDLAEGLALELARLASIRTAARPDAPSPEYPLFLSGYGMGKSFGGKAEDVVRALELRGSLDSLEREWLSLEKPHPDTPSRLKAVSAHTQAACAQAAADLGQDAFLKAPLRANPQRIVFLPKGGLFLDAIRRHEIAAEKWPGGYLATLDPGQFRQALPVARPTVIFPSVPDYSRSLNLETRDQRRVRVQSALAHGGPSAADYQESILRMRAELLAVLSGFLSADRSLPPSSREALESARTEELLCLDLTPLAFRPDANPGSPVPAAAGASLASRLGILALFASRSGQPRIAQWGRDAAHGLKGAP